jgi:deoxyribonuclease-4
MAKIRRIGAHLSTRGGVEQAVERAHKIGANTLQVFSGSPRMWRRTSLKKIDAKAVKANQEKYDVTPIFTHALYLVNLASDKPELVKKSVEAIKHDLSFDAHLDGAGVIVHLGSHQGRGWEAVKDNLVKHIKEVLADTPKNSTLLIENSAGQKGKIASDLNEVRWLLDQVDSPRLGWCFDTCHGHAAGYSLVNGDDSVLKLMAELKLFNLLKCIHVNDSKDDAGSGRDRHENIGDGEIPQDDLKTFLNNAHFADIPLVTEVPGIDGDGPDEENVSRIRSLVE